MVRPHGWISDEVRFSDGEVMVPAVPHFTVSLNAGAGDNFQFTLEFSDMQELLELLAKIRSAGQAAVDQVATAART